MATRFNERAAACLARIAEIIVSSAVLLTPTAILAAGPFSILSFPTAGREVDRTGKEDASTALAGAVSAANTYTSRGEPACVYIPAGNYRIVSPPPAFTGAGCIRGDGESQSILHLDPHFSGDLFSWSEAWYNTFPGPMVVGLKVIGSKNADRSQNALVFYDRNDNVFIDNVEVDNLPGRALYSGATKTVPSAYMRESNIRAMRMFNDGAPGIPVVEFNSQGPATDDATNEIRLSQIDIFGANGPSFVIRNEGKSVVRDINIDGLRIEGEQNGRVKADLLTIGDEVMKGNVNNIVILGVELIDPYRGFPALRMTAPRGVAAPYQITVQGLIGGGAPNGEGLRIDAGRDSFFRLSGIHTFDTNVVIGPGVSNIELDGGGQESDWTYKIDATSAGAIKVPAWRFGDPRTFKSSNPAPLSSLAPLR